MERATSGAIMVPTVVILAALLGVGCGRGGEPDAAPSPAVRIILAGDVMLGRGLADIVATDPESMLAELRRPVRNADAALANLESPLTVRPFAGNGPNDLRADPAAAQLLADAGFDVMSIANNHAGDAGPVTVVDTIASLDAAGIRAMGGGGDAGEASAPVVLAIGDLRIGLLAFDATGIGPQASSTGPGVATWEADDALSLVDDLRADVDVLIVSIHGGAEYLLTPDATMREISAQLAEHSVDVVWGHGAHVVQPVAVSNGGDHARPTIAATSLGNLVFDQTRPGTDSGALLEVMAGPGGVVAYRVGVTNIDRGRVGFEGWTLPEDAGTLVDGEWWSLPTAPDLPQADQAALTSFSHGDAVAARRGNLLENGEDQLVVSFRRPWQPSALSRLLPDVQWSDSEGRSAHLGVFASDDVRPLWVASAVARPVADLAVCNGAIAVRYSTLDDATITGAGAWTWSGFGWDEAADLAGDRAIGCLDVDGDGATEPVVAGPG